MNTLNQRLTILESFSGTGTGTSLPQVLFKITSNLSTNQVFTSNVIAKYNNIVFCYPNTSDFNTSTYTYTVPVAGIYQFTFRLYPTHDVTHQARFSININNIDVSITGSTIANIETLTSLEECNVGDQVQVRCQLTNQLLQVYMSPLHSSFHGRLISTL